MEKFSSLRRSIDAVVPPEFKKNSGALGPYLVPIFSRFVYYKRLKFCLRAIKRFARRGENMTDEICTEIEKDLDRLIYGRGFDYEYWPEII